MKVIKNYFFNLSFYLLQKKAMNYPTKKPHKLSNKRCCKNLKQRGKEFCIVLHIDNEGDILSNELE